MNCYEHTLIIKQELPGDQLKTLISKYQNLINKNSGKVIKTEEWGLKNFSRSIKNIRKGFYYHIKFEGSGKTIKELEKNQNIDPSLVRFLTVKVKEHDLKNVYFEKKRVLKKNMKRKKNFRNKKKDSKNSKLSLFQKADLKFSRECPLSGKDAPIVDYKNIKLLKKYISESGRILPTRVTSVSMKKQRQLSKSIKRARLLALI